MLTRFERIPTRNGKRPSTICGPLRIHCSDNGDTDGEVSAPEAVGTLSPSDRLHSEVVGQSVEATERSISAEDALRLVLDTTPALIHTGRPDGYLDYFNQRWLEFLGLPLEEVGGWRWTGAVHPEDVAGLLQKWHAALGSGEPLEVEARVRRADGEYRLLLHRKVPLRDERGTIVKWFGSSIDIEDRKRADERIWQTAQNLQRSEFYLQQGQRLTQCGSWSFLPSGECDYWSPELYRILGFDPSDGIPVLADYLKVIHPDDRSIVEKTLEKMIAEGIAATSSNGSFELTESFASYVASAFR